MLKREGKEKSFLSSSSTMLLLKGKRRLKINLYDSHEQYKDGRELAKTGPLIFKTSVEKVFCIRFDIIQFQNSFAVDFAQDFH